MQNLTSNFPPPPNIFLRPINPHTPLKLPIFQSKSLDNIHTVNGKTELVGLFRFRLHLCYGMFSRKLAFVFGGVQTAFETDFVAS